MSDDYKNEKAKPSQSSMQAIRPGAPAAESSKMQNFENWKHEVQDFGGAEGPSAPGHKDQIANFVRLGLRERGISVEEFEGKKISRAEFDELIKQAHEDMRKVRA